MKHVAQVDVARNTGVYMAGGEALALFGNAAG